MLGGFSEGDTTTEAFEVSAAGASIAAGSSLVAGADLEEDDLDRSLTAMDWLPKLNVKEAGPETDVDLDVSGGHAAVSGSRGPHPASAMELGDVDANGKPPYR